MYEGDGLIHSGSVQRFSEVSPREARSVHKPKGGAIYRLLHGIVALFSMSARQS